MENHDSLKQRLVGAAVLISLVVVFLPMLVDDGPGPSPDHPAVPQKPDWNFSGWKGDQYQIPDKPQRPVVEAIDPGTLASADPQQSDDAPQNDARQSAGSTPAAPGDSAAPVTPGRTSGDLLEATVKSGDTLYGIFRRLGLEPTQVREVVKVSGARAPLSRLRPGQRIRLRVDAQKHIVAMEYLHSGGPALRIKRIGGRLQNVTGARQAGWAEKPAASTASAATASPATTTGSKSAPKVSPPPRPSREQGPVAWAVQIGVYKDWEAARVVQSRLRGKGYPAFLKSTDQQGSKRWHLKIGPQLKKSDAIALARKIQQETGGKPLVVGYP